MQSRVVRFIIFLIIAGIAAVAVYIVKNPAALKLTKEKRVHISPTNVSGSPSSSQAIKLESAYVELFFSDPNSDLLVREKRNVVWKEGDVKNQIRAILAALWQGSRQDLLNPIPSQVVVQGISVSGGVATIDFSRELIQNHPGGTLAEMHTIYAIVNSLLLNVGTLSKIQILVEGTPPETLKGHIDCRNPFTANLSIVKKS